MGGLKNLTNGVVQPDIADLLATMPSIESAAFSEIEKDKAFEHCMKVIETMIREPRNGQQQVVSMLLGRKADTYLPLQPDVLREVFPVLFYEVLKDTNKAMKFLRTYILLHNSGIIWDTPVSFKSFEESIRRSDPAAMGALKLLEYHGWFKQLPPEERKRRILQKEVIKKTIVDVMESVLAEVERQGKESKIVVYGPNPFTKYTDYDAFRATIEQQIFNRLKKKYGKHPQLELRTDKNINNAVEMLKSVCYSG